MLLSWKNRKNISDLNTIFYFTISSYRITGGTSLSLLVFVLLLDLLLF